VEFARLSCFLILSNWHSRIPAGGQAGEPMTHTEGGSQFVVQVAGGHGLIETDLGDDVVAFALPGEGLLGRIRLFAECRPARAATC
jgi:hypothetical protein